MNDKQPLRKLNYVEAAAFLGLKPGTMRIKVMKREIKFSRLGKRVLFDISDLEEYFCENSIQPLSARGVKP
jgi:excisionase family DNA binding protein